MKDGDIYFWKWKTHEDRFMPYHCKSTKSVAHDGTLYDTYWGHRGESVKVEDVFLTFKGNINTLVEIPEYDIDYYRHEDVVDMRHANSSMGKVYIQAGAKRDAAIMREIAVYQIERNESEIRMARHTIERLNEIIAQIDAGDLDSISIPRVR